MSEIRQRKTADEEELPIDQDNQGINVAELTVALRKTNVRQASYLGARLASFDRNNDGHISIGELGAVVEDLVFKENQNNMMRKLLIGSIVTVVVLMVSIFLVLVLPLLLLQKMSLLIMVL